MEYVGSTYKILYHRALDNPIKKEWIDWAIEMIQAGYETESLLYLASFDLSETQFKVQEVADRAFKELHLDFSDKEQTIKNYVNYIVEAAISGRIAYSKALRSLKKIYQDTDMPGYFQDFNSLYWAKDDLTNRGHQWHWPDANRDNIDSIIEEYFKNWKTKFQIGAMKPNSESNEPNHSSL